MAVKRGTDGGRNDEIRRNVVEMRLLRRMCIKPYDKYGDSRIMQGRCNYNE